MNLDLFRRRFLLLTGHSPFLWQERLFALLLSGPLPSLCDLPTGLGKTSILALWLLALAEQVLRGLPLTLPRRLVYVVNRRVVVDQASDDADKLLEALQTVAQLQPVADALCSLAALPGVQPFALSTLRGQHADNREWSADPCRPAIIVGTVDMIGSRLLFSAYRAGYRTKPLHAAFLGQDALIVHDEAHLEPTFQHLLEAVKTEQAAARDPQPVRVMQLSATTRAAQESGFTLTPEEAAESLVAQRLNARKLLHLHPLDDPKQLPDELAARALRHEGSNVAVLVFARTVESVEKTAALLAKDGRGKRVRTLTGTMRGKERDALVEEPVFLRFLPKPATTTAAAAPSPLKPTGGDQLALFSQPEPDTGPASPAPAIADGTVYLVCTSAGEVGVNLSADHLVCDLTTFESMAQRFGRVNRFGLRADTEVDVVHHVDAKEAAENENSFEARKQRTLALLEQLHGDASPAALHQLPATERAEAFSKTPGFLETSGILFDAWALTSITEPLPGRPPVEPYLHGIEEGEAPTTRVAWRDEVRLLTGEDGDLLSPFNEGDLKTLLTEYPLKPQELLQDRSYRVAEVLARLAKRTPTAGKLPVWLLDDEGKVTPFTLEELTNKDDKRNKDRLNGRTLLLPPAAGGLSASGMLDAGATDPVEDVSDEWLDAKGQPRRVRLWSGEATKAPSEPQRAGMRLLRKIDVRPNVDEEPSDEEGSQARRFWWWYENPRGADNEGSEAGRAAVELQAHIDQVEEYARRFAEALGLPPAVVEAVRLAGRAHDLGKHRVGWQRNIGNFDDNFWLAKPGSRKTARDPHFSYRHEFGSLLDVLALAEGDAASLPPDDADGMRDLTLHLIAAHHGRARPHFSSDEAMDLLHPRAHADAVAAETPLRFARLQRRHGRWGLAFLESLLRAADYAASAKPDKTLEDAV